VRMETANVDPVPEAPRVSLVRVRRPAFPTPSGFWPLLALYGLIALIQFDQIEEDTFIYFRAAAHLARGEGYVFNTGGERIETGSSVVWQLLLAAGWLTRLDLVVFTKAVSLLLGAAALYLLLRVSERVVENPVIRLLPAVLLIVSTPFHFWVQRGLETPLYVFSILLLAFVLLDGALARRWYLPVLLVAFSRSEGPLVLLGLAGFAYFQRREWRGHVPGVAIVLGTLAASEVARFFYFHDLVPHAFYLKIHNFPGLGWASVRQYFVETRVVLLLLLAAIGLARKAAWTRALVVVAVLDLPFLLWATRTGAGTNNNRHLAPALPLLYVVVARGLDVLISRRPYLVHPIAFGAGLHCLWLGVEAPGFDMSLQKTRNPLAVIAERALADPGRHLRNIGHVLSGRPKPVVGGQDYETDQITANTQYLVGDFIGRTYPKGITVVYDQMGQTPWYAGLDKTFIDTFGLTYKRTAFALYNRDTHGDDGVYGRYRSVSERLVGLVEDQPARHWTARQVIDHLFSLEPELFLFVGIQVEHHVDGRREYLPGLLGDLVQDPRMSERYVRRDKWFLLFFERKDLVGHVPWAPGEEVIPGKADKLPR